MRKLIFTATLMLTVAGIISCKKNEASAGGEDNTVSAAVLAKVSALGLSNKNVYKVDGGYIAEGDIFLDDATLNSAAERKLLVIANEEQYHTTNLVSSLPRTITVRYSGTTASVSLAIDSAIARYNALPASFRLRFARVASTAPADITVSNVILAVYIASAGFPTNGNPFNSIKFNLLYSNWDNKALTTVIAHEMGHCIGFRHTDFMGREYSCGGTATNEGDGGVGAIHIPGTPTGPDPTSWMLACTSNGVNRPFNANDLLALNYLY